MSLPRDEQPLQRSSLVSTDMAWKIAMSHRDAVRADIVARIRHAASVVGPDEVARTAHTLERMAQVIEAERT